MEWIDVKLHTELADAARKLARDQDITMGQLIRDLVAREVTRARKARPPVRADEQLVAPLRARLAHDLASARDWSELGQRLKRQGYMLVAAGGGLALHELGTGNRICKASDLGFSYSRLAQRIGAPFPGHPRTSSQHGFTIHPHSPVTDLTEDYDVIEPF